MTNIKREDLFKASENKIITSTQAEALWNYLIQIQGDTPHFEFAHVMYYFGGFLAIGAITLFVTLSWEAIQGTGLFILSSCLFLLGALLIHYFLEKQLIIPAGIMSVFCVALVPLAIYNIQLILGWFPSDSIHYRGFYNWIQGYWVPMELGTVIVGLIMLYIYQFPFLIFPIAFALWFLSMDLYCLFFDVDNFTLRARFSIYFGLLMILSALYMDFKYDDPGKDYAYWLYLFGVMTFWGGLSCQSSESELSKLIYCMINIIMIFTGVILNRRVFTVFGAIGVFGYLSHLSFSVFADSLSFPVVLVFLGILIMLAASRWSNVEKKIILLMGPYLSKKILARHTNSSI